MAYWHGYVLVALDDDAPDVPSKAARQRIRAALARLNRPWKGIQPARQFQARVSLDGRKAIYEVTVDDLDKAWQQAVKALPQQAKHVQVAFLAFGKSWEASRAAAHSYLLAHADEWEPKAWRSHLTS